VATKSKPADVQQVPAKAATLDGALVEELKEIERLLSVTGASLEELEALEESTPWSYELTWLIRGFTEDALVNLKDHVRRIMSLRSESLGGLADDDLELLHAAGGKH
jgi:hypothetical protein